MPKTSKLQRQVSDFLYLNCNYLIRENYRPEWLISERGTRLELDFYIEEIQLAIEVQGAQHYQFIEHFHKNADGFKRQLVDDRYKKDYCEKHNITFLEICSESEIGTIRENVQSKSRRIPILSSEDLESLVPPFRRGKSTSSENQYPEYQQSKIPSYNKNNKLSVKGLALIGESNLLTTKQAKFNVLTNRLHVWMLDKQDVPYEYEVLKNAFHNFLEKFYLARPIDMTIEFIEFLKVHFSDERYMEGLWEVEQYSHIFRQKCI
jgi:hypothetical protein